MVGWRWRTTKRSSSSSDDRFTWLAGERHPFGEVEYPFDVLLGLGERRDSVVFPNRAMPGVVGSQDVVQRSSRYLGHQGSVHAVECCGRVDGIDRIPHICGAVAVGIEPVLLPGGWHELGYPLSARWADSVALPGALDGDLCCQDPGGNGGTARCRLGDHRAEFGRDGGRTAEATAVAGLLEALPIQGTSQPRHSDREHRNHSDPDRPGGR